MWLSLLLLVILTVAAVFLARWIGSRIALPFLTAIAGYFPFVLEAQESFLRGYLVLFLWTLLLSVLILRLASKEPERMESIIWRSTEYTRSMFQWLKTGVLLEGSPRQVIFFHLKQTVLYCLIAFFSANFLSLVLGSALLNYMNFYVARLASGSTRPERAFLLGWNPWSIIRVLSFLHLGIATGTLSMGLLWSIQWWYSIVLFLPGVAGVLLDIILKLTLSERWRQHLGTSVLNNKI